MINGSCKTCTPCEGCNLTQIGLSEDMAVDEARPCDMCDPCNSSMECSSCGNAFCRCDIIIDTEDGLMHSDCARREGENAL